VPALDSKYLLEDCRLIATFGMFHIQSIVPKFFYWYDGILEIWEKLHRAFWKLACSKRTFKNPMVKEDGQAFR
jgi:hypothetical protein